MVCRDNGGDDGLQDMIVGYWSDRSAGMRCATKILLESTTWAGLQLRDLVHAPKASRALDVCTGAGHMAIELARMGLSVTAIDLSPEMVRVARDAAEEEGVDVTFSVQDATCPDFPEGSFDVIVVKDGLWNMLHPDTAIANWRRLLRPGGQLIIFDANYYLYYNDPDYLRRKTFFDAKYGVDSDLHGRTNVNNVDLTIIDDLAKDLPLSSEFRPSWDVKELLANGFTDVFIRNLDRENYYVEGENGLRDTPMNFVISAKVPYSFREHGSSDSGSDEFLRNIQRQCISLGEPLKCLANPHCVRILVALTEGEFDVNELSTMFCISPSLTSHHLQSLKKAGLVKSSKRGKNVYYSVRNPNTVRDLLGILSELNHVIDD